MDEIQIEEFEPEAFYEMTMQRLQVLNCVPKSKRPNVDKLVKELRTYYTRAFEGKNNYNGCLLPPFIHGDSGKWQYNNWTPKKGDVLVSTYPKSGTTWLREIARHLFNYGNEENMKASKKISNNVYLESSNPTLHDVYNKLPLTRRVYVTHLHTEVLNMERITESGCKIIYVFRNPKDVLLSWYNFLFELHPMYIECMAKQCPKDWNKFFEMYISGKQPDFSKEGQWHPHNILSWYPYLNKNHVKFIRFEDLKMDPVGKIQEISDFLECDRTKKEISEIANATSFDSLKAVAGHESIFYRKGVIGDWKNKFTVAQSELMDKKFGELLSGIDIQFIYE